MPDQEIKTIDEGNLPDPVMDVLKDIKDKVEKMEKPAEETPKSVPTADAWQRAREEERKALGFTEEQMQAHERTVARISAPVVEQSAWSKIEKKADIENYRKEIEEELKLYPPERRNGEMLEKIYYFVKGKHADSKPRETPRTTTVERTRVSGGPGYTGADQGLAGGGEGAPSGEADLSDQEKFVADKLGVGHKDYLQAKKVGKEIRELRIPDTRPVNSLADVELKRLTGKR